MDVKHKMDGGQRTPGTVDIEGGVRGGAVVNIEGGQRTGSGQMFFDGGICVPSGPSMLEGGQRTASSDVSEQLSVAGER